MDETTVQRSILGKLMFLRDRPFLYIARFIPKWITPNLITVLRIFLIIPIYLLYMQEQYIWTTVLFILFLLSDALDGAVARYRNTITKIGALLDPAADKIIFVSILLMVGVGKLSTAVIATILLLEASLVLFAVVIGPILIVAFKYRPKIGANVYGKIKFGTEGMAVSLLLLWPKIDSIIFIGEVLMWIAAAFALLSIITHFVTKEKRETRESA